jgi:hypothetical protein
MSTLSDWALVALLIAIAAMAYAPDIAEVARRAVHRVHGEPPPPVSVADPHPTSAPHGCAPTWREIARDTRKSGGWL